MIDERFRSWLARAGDVPARWLAAFATPNQLTAAAFVIALGAAWLVSRGLTLPGLALWLVSRILDGFDGLVARISERTSWFGGYFDITADMAAYGAMALAFAAAMPADRTLWMLVLQGYLLVITSTLALSSLLERAHREVGGNRSIRFTTSLAEGGETTIVYALIAWRPTWSQPVLFGWCLILVLTVIQRTWVAWRVLR